MDLNKIVRRLAAHELVARLTRRLAVEFPSQEALNKYLKKHPAADKSLHWVKDDTAGKQRAIQRETDVVSLIKEESEKSWERAEKEVEEFSSGISEHVKGVFAAVPKISSKIQEAVAEPSEAKKKLESKETKKERTKARKELKAQLRESLAGKPIVKNLAKRYGLEDKDVEDTVLNFFVKGGDKDTVVDLETSISKKAKVAYRTRKISESRQTGIFPPELLEFIPANLGFHIDNQHNTKLVEHFGNKKKTMQVKIHEMRLLLLQKNDIMAKMAKDLKSPDEKTRMLALIVGMGINTGIRTGHTGNHVEVHDEDTGEVTEEETYGATTLLAKHVSIAREGVARLDFPGKKGTQNIAEVTDQELTHHLQEFTRDKGPDQPVFVTKKGQEVSATDVNEYLKEFGITFTDFRKLRGTQEVFDGLKHDMEGIYREVAEHQEANQERAREQVVKVLYERLKKIFEEAQKRLNHESVDVTIDSYVNPMVVINMLSTGAMAETMDEAIEENGQINFNIDAIMREAEKYMRKAA